ncbi:MAG: tyrosine-type recombinase/integrase [Gemmatimonadetes bacterium]|nr:tyrosine-type recombinase/integrase [Gemmatimonadota bacterium]MYJ69255.1 tyrosine-type recombinase/integrase [Gemmatimonadota bacterium]
MNRPNGLSATFTRTVKTPGRYGDGRGGFGLTLLVRIGAGGRVLKSWVQRVRIDGRETNVGLGVYPVVSLSEARAKALANRRAIAEGRHPKTGDTGQPTFGQAAEKVIALQAKGWKAGSRLPDQWRQTLRDYAFPVIGSKLVGEVTGLDVLAVLQPVWTAKPSTGRKVRQRIGAVMAWAIAKGYRADNPAEAIAAALPKTATRHKHHKAVNHAQVADALAKVRQSGAGVRALAVEFLVLTACRAAEVAGARWDEIEGDTWTIPAARTKTNRPHRVPLSAAALAVLEAAKTTARRSPFVFPGQTGKPLPRQAFGRTLKAAQVAGTAHGFRSTFRDWCAETGVPREVAERALAHVVRNATEAAYNRTDLLERRREVMAAWGAYCGVS